MILLILISLNSIFFSCNEAKVNSAKEIDTQTEESTVLVSQTDVAKETMTTTVKSDLVEKVKEVVEESTTDAVVLRHEAREEQSTSVLTEEKIIESSPIAVKETKVETVETEEPREVVVEKVETIVVEPMKVIEAGHADFDALLSQYVKNGKVDYAGIKAAQSKLDAYLDFLSNNAPSTSDKTKAALAFWMNAYNAYTIKLIVDNYPVKSIMDLHGGKPWDKKWINIGSSTYSLNQLEHDIIRPVFNEPRIHFAVVCAANSCPPLASYAFTASNVDSKLDALTKTFINDSKFNQITENKVTISPIFDWYGKDFGNVLAYIQRYAKPSVGDQAKIKFTEYDWNLNKQ